MKATQKKKPGKTRARAASEYVVIFEPGTRNWSAFVPDLPGCAATGRTRAITEQRIIDAIKMHVESLRFHGEAVPAPTTQAGKVKVAS